MTDTQLYLAIGVPLIAGMLFNGGMFLITNQRISDLTARFNTFEASVNARFEILTGKVAELSDRLARVEERLEHR